MSILPNARNLHISKSHFINVVNPEHTDRSGLNKLLKHSIMVASHDSSARWLPPQCHLGTREDYIAALTEWGSKPEVNLLETIIWVNGPAGVGKSAIAQSVADALGELLGCSFFFSRPNGRDDPNTFFTTLSYQLAVRFPDSGYSEIVNETIRRDPSIVEKAIPDQFRHLFVIPLQKLRIDEKLLSPKVIIVDGLDECRSEGAHLTIISTIIKSVRAMSTPFTWLTLSRLEPHIVAAFSSSLAIPVTRHMELTISPSLNPQIRLFFTEKLTEIWTNKAIASSWPAAEDITALVNFSAGLFAHSHALVLFIDDPDSEGPQHQLCAVLSLADEIKQAGEKHPLAALDFFYDVLVLKQIPEAKRTSIRIMLLVYRMGLMISNQDVGVDTKIVANVLGKQDDQVRDLCCSLHSVMRLDHVGRYVFYHASFMDFLNDKSRSHYECIWSDPIPTMLFDHVRPLLDGISTYEHYSVYEMRDQLIPQPPVSCGILDSQSLLTIYKILVFAFFKALELMPQECMNDDRRREAIRSFDYRKVAFEDFFNDVDFKLLRSKLERTGILHYLAPLSPQRSNLIKHFRDFLQKNMHLQRRIQAIEDRREGELRLFPAIFLGQ